MGNNDRNQQNIGNQQNQSGMGKDSSTQRQEGQGKQNTDRSMTDKTRDQQSQSGQRSAPPKSGSDH